MMGRIGKVKICKLALYMQNPVLLIKNQLWLELERTEKIFWAAKTWLTACWSFSFYQTLRSPLPACPIPIAKLVNPFDVQQLLLYFSNFAWSYLFWSWRFCQNYRRTFRWRLFRIRIVISVLFLAISSTSSLRRPSTDTSSVTSTTAIFHSVLKSPTGNEINIRTT